MIVTKPGFTDDFVIDDMATTLDIIRAHLKGHFECIAMTNEEMIDLIDESLCMVHEVDDNTQPGATP